jgi:hypothetical protein
MSYALPTLSDFHEISRAAGMVVQRRMPRFLRVLRAAASRSWP